MRPEKVRDKPGKERIRKGTKDRKDGLRTAEPEGIRPFENRIRILRRPPRGHIS